VESLTRAWELGGYPLLLIALLGWCVVVEAWWIYRIAMHTHQRDIQDAVLKERLIHALKTLKESLDSVTKERR